MGNVIVCPGCRAAMAVLLHSRMVANSAGTTVASLAMPLTMNRVPVRAFSGRPPSDGGEKRASRQVPVHCGLGSILALAIVSL